MVKHLILARPSAGLAYGVFRCSDQRPKPLLLARFKEALENVLKAHEETKIPPQTEFSVFSLVIGISMVKLDLDSSILSPYSRYGLMDKITAFRQKGANFLIRSSLPQAAHATAATDLADTLNMLYGGTELFDADQAPKKPLMDVFYEKEPGRYVSRMAEQLLLSGRTGELEAYENAMGIKLL